MTKIKTGGSAKGRKMRTFKTTGKNRGNMMANGRNGSIIKGTKGKKAKIKRMSGKGHKHSGGSK